jgi:hypothetical protein
VLRLAALEAQLPVNRSKVLRGRIVNLSTSVQASCRNQLLFREVNERIREVAGKSGILGPAAFVCECAHTDCTEAVELAFMPTRQETLVAIQRSSRQANERFEQLAGARADGHLMPFLCECADEHCLGQITLTATDYYAIHIDRSQFVVLYGHLIIRGETMVQQADGFRLVTKADLG